MNAGATIKTLRERRGLSQRQLAIKVNMSQGRISGYETEVTEPSVKAFAQILNALGYELVVKKRSE